MRALTAAAAAVLLAVATPGIAPASAPPAFVLSPEGNHLWAYQADGERQLVSRAVNGADPGAQAPNGIARDINGQVCVSPDGHHVVTGEDTVLGAAAGGDGGSSHDPRVAGWGWFTIRGRSLGAITIDQTGKLAPAAGRGPGYAGDPDNYGCGFLDGRRLLTTAIGNTLPGEPANGQLFLWFGPFDRGYQTVTDPATGVRFFAGTVDHCQIDAGLATAGGVAIAANGDVYVAANRPDLAGRPGGVFRYSGRWPDTWEECTPEYLAAHITRTALIPTLPAVPVDLHALTPSAVAISPHGTLYVSSVFSGTIAEYAMDGTWLRDLHPTTPVAVPTGPFGDTPYGLAVAPDGTLWAADLGIVGDGPVSGEGSLWRIDFDPEGDPKPAVRVRAGLTFPDGLGIYQPR